MSARNLRTETLAAEAARVGDELRDAREGIGATVEEMADRLRISRRHLAALEEGRIRDLPGSTYALGFVRSYAQALGLDAAEMARRVRDGASTARPSADLVFPEPVPERGVPAGVVVLIGGLVAIGAYVAWWQWSGTGERTVDRVPVPPPAIEQAARSAPEPAPVLPPTMGQAVPVGPTSPNRNGAASPAPAAPPAVATPPVAPVPAPAVPPGSQAAAPGAPPAPAARLPGVPAAPSSVAPASPAATPAPPAGASSVAGAPTSPAAPGAVPAPVPASPPAVPPATPTAPGDGGRIVLRGGTEDAWFEIKEGGRNGRRVLQRVLRPNETFQVPAREGLVLNTGRAQAMDILVDGQPSQVLAGRTGVARDIELNPEQLRAAAPRP